MLRCPKCGTDNLLSAVFCRGCGERMNLDEIKPDDFQNIGTKKDSTTMQNIIGGAIIGVLVVVFLVGFLFPSCGALSTTEAGQKAAADKYLSSPTATYTDQEITDFCNYMLARSGEDGDGPAIKRISVRCLEDGKVKTYVRAVFFGFLPATVTVTCDVSASDSVSLSGGGVKIGLLPVPEGLEDSLFYPVRSACSGIMRDVNTKVRKVEVKAGEATITHGKVRLE
ncbi:MAG: hypothetical protein ACI4SG_08095 [Oligosphaeraceae bacterium]